MCAWPRVQAASISELRGAHRAYLADITRRCALYDASAVSAVFGLVLALHRDVTAQCAGTTSSGVAWEALVEASERQFALLAGALPHVYAGHVLGSGAAQQDVTVVDSRVF